MKSISASVTSFFIRKQFKLQTSNQNQIPISKVILFLLKTPLVWQFYSKLVNITKNELVQMFKFLLTHNFITKSLGS